MPSSYCRSNALLLHRSANKDIRRRCQRRSCEKRGSASTRRSRVRIMQRDIAVSATSATSHMENMSCVFPAKLKAALPRRFPAGMWKETTDPGKRGANGRSPESGETLSPAAGGGVSRSGSRHAAALAFADISSQSPAVLGLFLELRTGKMAQIGLGPLAGTAGTAARRREAGSGKAGSRTGKMVEMASGRATPEREAMLALVKMWGRSIVVSQMLRVFNRPTEARNHEAMCSIKSKDQLDTCEAAVNTSATTGTKNLAEALEV
ncbi:unnamed protein product [Symbiodinium necroappetens]|uniref:Uncharacterized protein n=1 Tax=Symbiodinium necroappetens TaxID=1628268 RepID=A0A812MNF9_9DINO|nr:unnamed protein product [Symbiodinium necroappetens]